MKLLIPYWYTYHLNEISSIIQEKHTVFPYRNMPRNYHYDPVFRRDFTKTLTESNIDGVFSLQYFPIISNICEKLHIPYICWCCNDQINQLLLTESITNNCNILFLADSQWVEKLHHSGIRSVYYLPWAASHKSISCGESKTGSHTLQADISMIDYSDTDAWIQYLTLISRIDKRTKGFLDGLLQAQQTIYGYHLVANALNETVLSSIQSALPLSGPQNSIATPEELYAFQIFYPAITQKESQNIMQLLDRRKDWKTMIYTSAAREQYRHIIQQELPDNDMELLTQYANSKINILAAPREIQNGIPRQAMDIMGCGSLLITNFQNDYLRFFEPGKDYIYYESPEDMIDKAQYFLQHEKERNDIINNAFQKIREAHSLEKRIHELFSLLNNIV